MNKDFSKGFVRFLWIGLISIFLVMTAGSIVRITGSGMGCPDWPTCFGKAIPPTSIEQLPSNYKDIYAEKRAHKLDKFIQILNTIGLNKQAQKLEQNKNSILVEQTFNASNTWTEYINRLFGFLCGNAILIAFLWILFRYRKPKLILVASVNLVFLVLQAWFGSIVVTTNLIPWTITIHMFLSIVIIALQLYLIRLSSPVQRKNINVKSWLFWLILFTLIISIIQMFLGTQVRESIDWMTKSGVSRINWDNNFSVAFLLHRSFSWLVLILIAVLYWYNRKNDKIQLINYIFYFLVTELLVGIVLAYFNVPGIAQTTHLMLATFLITALFLSAFRMKIIKP